MNSPHTSSSSSDPNRCLFAEDAAKLLSVPASALAKMRLDGSGPAFVKIGRRVRYRYIDLQEWMAKRRYSSTSTRVDETKH